MSKKSKKEEEKITLAVSESEVTDLEFAEETKEVVQGIAEEVSPSPEGKPLDEVAHITITHPEEAHLEGAVADELPPAVLKESQVVADLPPCGSEFCSEGVCKDATGFINKFFKYKYEIVNLKPEQIYMISCALQIDYSGKETHIDKVNRIVEALGIQE